MMNKRRIPLQPLFLMTVFVFIMLDSRYAIPYNTILRWICPGLLLFFSFGSLVHKHISGYANKYYWIVLLAFGISTVNSINMSYSIERIVSFILITSSFYYYFTLVSVNGSLVKSISVFGCLYIIYGVLNFIFLQWGMSRPYGITGNANSFGHWANITFIFSLYFYQVKERRKWIYLLFMIMSAICTILSASRTATLILLMNILFVLWTNIRKGSAIFLVLGAIIAIFGMGLADGLLQQIPGVARILERSGIGEDRELLWDYGMQLISQKPWIGWGYGVSISLNHIKGLAFHNSYLTIAIEAGVIGFISVIVLLLSVIYRGMLLYRATHLFEIKVMLLLVVDRLVAFVGESSMISVGSAEGFFFWGVITWIVVASFRGVEER